MKNRKSDIYLAELIKKYGKEANAKEVMEKERAKC